MDHIVFLDKATVPIDMPSIDRPHVLELYEASRRDQIISRASEATIIITSKVRLDATILSELPRARMIAVPATGTDHIDIAYCDRKGILVRNCADYSVDAVPEHAIALMFALMRNLVAFRTDLIGGHWQKSSHFSLFSHKVRDLRGARLGIIGAGKLGRRTGKLAAALGMEVSYADRKNATVVRDGFRHFDDVLSDSDIVSLHCALTPETYQMIGERELHLMQDDAILINTGRGALIDERALLYALRQRTIGGAGLDVLSVEPPPDDHPLLSEVLDNLIITPHIAWISDGSLKRLRSQLQRIILDYIDMRNTN